MEKEGNTVSDNEEVPGGNMSVLGAGKEVVETGVEDREEEEEEEEEGEEEVEDEGEDDIEEEDGYIFKFKAGENPFDFVEGTDFSIQPYKKFERLEYEALAEKKRKALANGQSERAAKRGRVEDIPGASFDEILEAMNYGSRRKLKEPKKRGRRKGSKKKLNRDVTKLLGDATLCYAQGQHEKAVSILRQVVLQAPDLPDSYHTLGLVYNAIGDDVKAMGFYMLAAHLMPKDSSLWKLLFSWSIDRGDIDQASYCLSKAIKAEPDDIDLLFHRASLYLERGDCEKAAETYDQIHQQCLGNVEALMTGAKLYQKCGHLERAICILEDYIKEHPTEADLDVVDLLASLYMGNKEFRKALERIEHADEVYCAGSELPLKLTTKEGICHAHLGNMEKAECLFANLGWETADDHSNLMIEVADSLLSLKHYNLALKYYLMFEEVNAGGNMGILYLKIAQCYLSTNERAQAIVFFYKVLQHLEDNINARLTLASLLLEEARDEEAISLLSPPKDSNPTSSSSSKLKPWWFNEKVKLKLCHIYKTRGMLESFVEVIFPLVRESLYIETLQEKIKVNKKKLPKRVLLERVKVLDGRESGNLFRGFRPVAPKSDLSKASRAKRLLQKRERIKEEKKAKALAAGVDVNYDDLDDEPALRMHRESPLPNLLKEEEYHNLIVDLCKALASLGRCSEALEIISLTLKLALNSLSIERKEELQLLGAQLAFSSTDTTHGFNFAKHVVKQYPYSISAWNCYYKVASSLTNRDSRHCKLLNSMQAKYKDCAPPYIIAGHQFTNISHHQDAARKYLEAYKIMPDSPLINLCVGSSLINLALGFRLQNKHQCVAQGLAFLYKNLKLCDNSQEALYNIARAYHHIGLVTLAVTYYEKVLATYQKDCPIPELFGENRNIKHQKSVYCDLRREAAYNLHLIYKESGALDLARQVLKDHCTF
ncbi:general transcription factor 3C polypeptide 3 [Benincasa hispida]|uniref:general transcription factor 3C polypeptide 3 n=1 Tax=Benincasa hispida TaxID=102211 RepID=UPI00190077FD|nr:general transcription factor 3C polypeptide 3 [Benincasa hispida]XP_038879314.1 general transcription factor 3C polypeptide 3 [Benincasa hispida]XP_038879315.1 general transcription factor 3C polypeptide 3 [Benincasa hispida]XP_038879316.1 general transcription factor 3C polypeptide 3 [Benincasa hispida]XP_038879317.1 general transcription factor 3C polypeptide 3 [Benincasa hispida]XP_038879318.1 general transcription factor 3C polypeptide 3 [Benincasa hispida]XP_038879319.1 general transc